MALDTRTKITVRLDDEMFHRLKVALAHGRETAQAIFERAASDYIALHEKE